MGLPHGTRFGPYEVLDALGAGGMGEVYRARDTKLDRHVALKILPEVFAADPERLERFQREARTLAGLNHPHIAQIHGLEEANGVRAIVMELVDGEDLSARIARGAVPLEEALPIARQIAAALEEAHDHGIIHRDLKPANIKVRNDGTVKVLDFGLAKAFDPANSSNSAAANSPTLTAHGTAIGVLLGTAAYMAPEQAQGKPVDKRADIWAFGVVLYEMLTGRRGFDGANVSEVLAAVLKETPSLDALPTPTPPSIHRLLRRCFQKDRRERFGDMSAVRLEIQDALAGDPTSASPHRPVATSGRERLAWLAAGVALMAVLSLLTVSYFRASPELPEVRAEVSSDSTTEPLSFALSPDGRRLVFVAGDGVASRLWLRPLATTSAQPLAGTEGATYPFWSPDSRSVAFFAGGKLMRLDIGSGLPRPLANVISPRGGSWNRDGVIVYAPTVLDPLWRVSESGREAAAPVTRLDPPRQTGHVFPHFLPDGQRFLFYVRGGVDHRGIYLGSLGSQDSTRLTAADTAGAYLAPGWLLFVRQGTLVARRFDSSRGELSGEPVEVVDQVGFQQNFGAFSTAAGVVTYRASGGGIQRRQLTWFDRSGKPAGTVGAVDDKGDGGDRNVGGPSLAVDGRIAFVQYGDIYIFDGVRTTRLTFDAGSDSNPVWSPDARWIAFRSNRKGVFDLYRKRSDGTGDDELLWESPLHKNPHAWSRDGRLLYSVDNDPKTGHDLWSLPLEKAGETPTVFLNGSYDERLGQFSPDGQWVAYVSNEMGQNEIYVRPFPGPGAQVLVSTAGGISPRWGKDGKELSYIAPDGTLMAAPIGVNQATLKPGIPIGLFPTRIVGGGRGPYIGHHQYIVAPDGRFLINVLIGEATTSPITLLLNWKPKS